MPMPRFSGGKTVTSFPPTKIRPRSGLWTPRRSSSSRVLPAPVGPTIARYWPSVTSRVTSVMENSGHRRLTCSSLIMFRFRQPGNGPEGHEYRQCNEEKKGGQRLGIRVAKEVVPLEQKGIYGPGIVGYHRHGPKLANGARPGHDGARKQRPPRERDRDAEEGAQETRT